MKQQVGGVGKSAILIMRTLAAGALIVGALAAPNLAIAAAPLLRRRTGLSDRDAQYGLKYAMRRGWVGYKESDGQAELTLTDSGRRRWKKVQLDNPNFSSRWDKRWRIVVFDIPSKKNLQRDALRNHLKRVGFRQLQESVWVIPYDCASLIKDLKLIYRLTDSEVRLIQAKSFDGDWAFADKFMLTK